VSGPVEMAEDGTVRLLSYPAEVVCHTPLCDGGSWTMKHPSRLSVRQYLVDDGDLAASGLGLGEYIARNHTRPDGVTLPDYGLMWVGSNIDHDGSTAEKPGTFKPLGFGGRDVPNAKDLISFSEVNGTWQWSRADNVTSVGSPVPPGSSVYLAFAAPTQASRSIPEFVESGCPAPPAPPSSPPACGAVSCELQYETQCAEVIRTVNGTKDKVSAACCADEMCVGADYRHADGAGDLCSSAERVPIPPPPRDPTLQTCFSPATPDMHLSRPDSSMASAGDGFASLDDAALACLASETCGAVMLDTSTSSYSTHMAGEEPVEASSPPGRYTLWPVAAICDGMVLKCSREPGKYRFAKLAGGRGVRRR